MGLQVEANLSETAILVLQGDLVPHPSGQPQRGIGNFILFWLVIAIVTVGAVWLMWITWH